MNRSIVAVLISLATTAPAAAQHVFPSDSALKALLEERIAGGTVPGIVVGIIEADGTRRFVAAGTSGTDRPLDSRTVFEIGSITKAFTAVLLAEMAEAGDLALDDPVAALLPDSVGLPVRGERSMTLADLSSQVSGLPRMPDNFAPADPTNPFADYSVTDLYAFLRGYSLGRAPGVQYEYSNIGVGLLGHVLALSAGVDYATLVRARVIDPLGMTDTRISLTDDMRARLAQGHDQGGQPVPNWDIPTLAGAGALRSTAADMLTFLAAHLDPPAGTLGRAMTIATEARYPIGGRGSIGLGWHLRDSGDSVVVWHNGGTGGYHSFAAFMPGRRVGVVVLANSQADIDDIGLHLLDPSVPITRPRPEVAVARATLEEYVGTYWLAPTFAIEVTVPGDRIYIQATGQQRFPAFASSDSTFFLRVVEAELTFQQDSTGAVTGLVLYQNGQQIPGRKAP